MTCFLSPIGTSCHFPRFLSPIVGVADTSPEGGSKVCLLKNPAPKEKAKLHVILSMSSEQTCLQGFANEDIHKAQAFCKNAKR